MHGARISFQTNRKPAIVISGGPSVGKTTVIKALEALRYPVMHEISTALIKEGNFSPVTDREAFQKEVLRRQLEGEAELLRLNKLCFVDRGLLDGAAYYALDGLEIPDQFDKLDVSHYALMFLLEDLALFEKNDVRPEFEDLAYSKRISTIIESHYKARQIPVVRVPALPVEDRLAFILSEVRTHCPSGSR